MRYSLEGEARLSTSAPRSRGRIAIAALLLSGAWLTAACEDDVDGTDGADGGARDAGDGSTRDGSTADAGARDGGGPDGGSSDGSTTDGGAADGGTSGATEGLTAALEAELDLNRLLQDPELRGELEATQGALDQAAPALMMIRTSLERARDELVSGGTAGEESARGATEEALLELDSIEALATNIGGLTGDVPFVLRQDELGVRAAVILAHTNRALAALGAGPSAPGAGHAITEAELEVPPSHQVEIVAEGLSFPAAIAVAPDGTIYVAEAGYSYGFIAAPARVLRIGQDGRMEEMAMGFDAPIAGLAASETTLFVSHRATISAVDLETGIVDDLITGLPAEGDHFNENIAIGPDNRLYFTMGTATNSGVVGLDNYLFGWLKGSPMFREIPCRDLTLTGVNLVSANILTEEVTDTATTGAYLPFGETSTAGQVVQGQTLCTGAILSASLDGSDLRVYADGFRNPYGLAFAPDGTLYATENGPDIRGSRPIVGPDVLWEVIEEGWYGFPDYFGGVLASDPSRIPEGMEATRPLIMNPPELATTPFAELAAHSSSNGLDFSFSNTFAPIGTAFIAQFGDITPLSAGGVVERAGRKVVEVTPAGDVRDFMTSAADENGDPFLRPTDVAFDPSDTLGRTMYVVHFGDVRSVPGGILPSPGTGALIRVTRTSTTP